MNPIFPPPPQPPIQVVRMTAKLLAYHVAQTVTQAKATTTPLEATHEQHKHLQHTRLVPLMPEQNDAAIRHNTRTQIHYGFEQEGSTFIAISHSEPPLSSIGTRNVTDYRVLGVCDSVLTER